VTAVDKAKASEGKESELNMVETQKISLELDVCAVFAKVESDLEGGVLSGHCFVNIYHSCKLI
jgi:hypothetical protein